jgi:hypothetical protein
VFENRVLRRMFGPKRDEETGGWRKLHNEELHNFSKYNWNNQVKKYEMGGACSNEWGRREMHIGHWWESQKEINHWKDQNVGRWTILKRILER